MSTISSKTLTSFKYVYLIIFFTLLSGIFYPLINELSLDIVIVGVFVLFIGLIGGILVFKSTTSETKKDSEPLKQEVALEKFNKDKSLEENWINFINTLKIKKPSLLRAVD